MRRELEGGLVLRSLSEGVETDRQRLPQFYSDTFAEAGEDDPAGLEAWTRDLLSPHHPTMTAENLWVVVDPAHGDRIVSALLLIPQTWQYDGIPFGMGRVELVATDKAYRRRGLIRALIEAAHARSADLGHIAQGITGIRNYYRRFGYGMSLDLGVRAVMPFATVPNLPEDHLPRYTLRAATEADSAALAAFDAAYQRTPAVTFRRDETLWQYELTGHTEHAPFNLRPHLIVDADGQAVGYVLMRANMSMPFFAVHGWVLGPQTSYLATFEDVLYGIRRYAERLYEDRPSLKPANIFFSSDMDPALDLLIQKTFPAHVRSDHLVYSWYIRVPDLPRFLMTIAPALEKRLEGSVAHRYTGTLRIVLFDLNGLTITFEDGRIREVTLDRMEEDDADAGFPDHSFLDVIFGRRRQEEIQHVLPDCFANRKAAALLGTMFPRQRSWTMPLA